MSRGRRDVANSLKEQAGRVTRSDAFKYRPHNTRFMRELPPPKYQVRGMKLAVRALSQQLRTVNARHIHQASRETITKMKPPNTLSLSAEHLLAKEVSLKSPHPPTRFKGFLALASCHGANLGKTLSPEGVDDLMDADYTCQEIQGPFRFMGQWYTQCKKEGSHDAAEALKNFTNHMTRVESLQVPVSRVEQECRCDAGSHVSTEKSATGVGSFLGCWQHQGIQEHELTAFISENENFLQKTGMIQKIDCNTLNKDNSDDNQWKDFLKNKQCTVYRKLLPSGIYEYRVHASFNDISASQLLRTNTDTKYRRKWDSYVIDLKIVDSDPYSNSELVHWVTRCPYPFATREYVYLRRHLIDDVSKVMVLLQKDTDATDIPTDPSIMRVSPYVSRAIIKSHSGSFDENGCDYMLCYYDDPKMKLPTRIMDCAASRGIAESTKRMHQATLDLKSYKGD